MKVINIIFQVELAHGSGVMVSKTDKEMAIRESNGDQVQLVCKALDMIYKEELPCMSALGTRKNKAVEKNVYTAIYRKYGYTKKLMENY